MRNPPIRLLAALFIAAASLAACFGQSRTWQATAQLDGGATIAMSLSPMFGIHSDWHRELAIENGPARHSIELFEDTGWWRGSNLYRHTSGIYALHEGQAGCAAFSTDPPASVARQWALCEKQSRADIQSALPGQPPPSKFYPDMSFLGSFLETHDDERIRFVPFDMADEPELPDIM